jgi:hypothetical protein
MFYCRFDCIIRYFHQIGILSESRFLLVNVNSLLVTNIILTKIKSSFKLILESRA